MTKLNQMQQLFLPSILLMALCRSGTSEARHCQFQNGGEGMFQEKNRDHDKRDHKFPGHPTEIFEQPPDPRVRHRSFFFHHGTPRRSRQLSATSCR
jgi:hypothetical protein